MLQYRSAHIFLYLRRILYSDTSKDKPYASDRSGGGGHLYKRRKNAGKSLQCLWDNSDGAEDSESDRSCAYGSEKCKNGDLSHGRI